MSDGIADRGAARQQLEPKFTAKEVCENLHIDARTLRRRLAENPQIRPLKPGRSMLFTRQDIDALEEAIRCRCTSSHPEIGKGIDSTSSEGRSVTEALRTLRLRETKRLLAKLRDAK